jgi:uncharacterized repeat protein (TIGR03803 family)
MRRICFVIATICILAGFGLRPAFGSDAASGKEKIIYSFTGGADGGFPLSDLTLDGEGNLYGTTSQGGSGCGSVGCGTVFELKRTQDGWKEEVLYHFTDSSGTAPLAGVIFDKAGNLYGTTEFGPTGDGSVFELSKNSRGEWTERTIYSFDRSVGAYPQADLVFDNQGNLYGTTLQGGTGTCLSNSGCGSVFELTPQPDGSWAETTIHLFTDAKGDGGMPSSGVVLDNAGNVYGMTQYGGNGLCESSSEGFGYMYGCGVVYEFTPHSDGSWSETIVYNFVRGGGFGVFPSGELFLGAANHLFGVTADGGDGIGAVFELEDTKKRGWQQSEAHIFYAGVDGVNPTGRLVADANGDLFGVTVRGSSTNVGIVFEVQRSDDGWKENIIHSFAKAPDGASPAAGLVLDSSGHLYGTTQYGGTGTACRYGCGTVYEVMP